MKKFLSFALALVMLFGACAAFSSCGGNEDENVIVIGGVGPLTGTAASYGISVKQGATLAVEEINANGGINGMQIRFLFEDDKALEADALSAYNSLMDNGMQVTIGATTSGSNQAILAPVKEDGILLVTPSASSMTSIDAPNAFRICFNDNAQGQAAAKYIGDHMTDIKKVAIIYDTSSDYSKGLMTSFKAQAQADNKFEIVAETSFDSTAGSATFATQIANINSSGAELLFMPLYYSEAYAIISQASSTLQGIKYFGCDGFDGILGIDNVDTSLLENVNILTPFVADENSDFVKNYKAKYNSTPDQFAADAYDAIYAIKAAVEKANVKVTDKDFNAKVVAAMGEITLDGETGKMTWDLETGEPNKDPIVVTIQNGQYHILSE